MGHMVATSVERVAAMMEETVAVPAGEGGGSVESQDVAALTVERAVAASSHRQDLCMWLGARLPARASMWAETARHTRMKVDHPPNSAPYRHAARHGDESDPPAVSGT